MEFSKVPTLTSDCSKCISNELQQPIKRKTLHCPRGKVNDRRSTAVTKGSCCCRAKGWRWRLREADREAYVLPVGATESVYAVSHLTSQQQGWQDKHILQPLLLQRWASWLGSLQAGLMQTYWESHRHPPYRLSNLCAPCTLLFRPWRLIAPAPV